MLSRERVVLVEARSAAWLTRQVFNVRLSSNGEITSLVKPFILHTQSPLPEYPQYRMI
jgi:hypothetical protein